MLAFNFVVAGVACSGGGGGGGGSGSSTERTRETAVRVMHASIDAAPVSLQVNAVFHQEAKYGIDQPYVPLTEGVAAIVGVKPATAELMFRRSDTIAKDTESTLLVYGSAGLDTLETELITDTVERPEKGQANVRFYHALTGRQRLSLHCSGTDSAGTAADITLTAKYGDASSYGSLPSGTISCRASNSDGSTVATQEFVVADRGELGVLLTGSSELGFVVLRGYTDLD